GCEHRVVARIRALARQVESRAGAAAARGVARERAAHERVLAIERGGGAVHGADEGAFTTPDHAEPYSSHCVRILAHRARPTRVPLASASRLAVPSAD